MIMAVVSSAVNKKLTLAFVRNAGEVLLGFKKRGFGAGRWNGFGGKVQPNESILDAAKREIQEECGLITKHLAEAGVLMFEFKGSAQLLEVHVFQTNEFKGEVQESEEMRPKWYPEKNLPYPEMWADDKLWVPLMLQQQPFYGYFYFQDMDQFTDYTLDTVSSVSKIKIPQKPLHQKDYHILSTDIM